MNRLKAYTTQHYLLTCFMGGALLGTLCFICIYGVCPLDVKNIAYIINEGTDLPGQYLGWDAYRYAGWKYGIGLFDTFTYPQTTSFGLADTVPLLGTMFKIFSPILPRTFQYVGIWGILCFFFQGGFSAIIIRKFSNNSIVSVFLSIPFIFASSVLTNLFFHHAEAGQWVLLMALSIWLYNKEKDHRNIRESIIWGLVGLITVGVCVYFIPMVGMIFLGYSINCILNDRKNIIPMVLGLFSFLGMCILYLGIMGAFHSNFSTNNEYYAEYIDRLYRCGANLNAFINSWGISYFGHFYNLAKDGQGEGFAYLGAGMLIALVVAVSVKVADLLYNKREIEKSEYTQEGGEYGTEKRRDFNLCVALVIVIILSIIVGIGPTLSFNSKVIWNIPYPNFILKLWCNFRSTGRMIWPAFYIIFIFIYKILFGFCKGKQSKYLVTTFLGICCIIQIIDFEPYMVGKHKYFAHYQELETTIHDVAWDKLGEIYRHMVVLPNYMLNRSDERYYLGKYATDYDLTLNDFYLSRQDLIDQTPAYQEEFKKGNFGEETFYVFPYNYLDAFLEYDLHYYLLDRYIVGTADDISTVINKKEIDKEEVKALKKNQNYVYNDIDYSPVFDPIYYYYVYSDLWEVALSDTDKLFNHFLTKGIPEGRQASINFSPVMYKEKNGDLTVLGEEWEEYYLHYLVYGINEDRVSN